MIEGYQIRAARGYMGWTRAVLAKETGISPETIKRVEKEQGNLSHESEEAIINAFAERGLIFEEGGIKKLAKCIKCGAEQHGT